MASLSQLKQVEEYMRYRKLPGKLKRRVHEYYYQRYHGQLFSEERIIKDLSQTLREVNALDRKQISIK